MAMLDTLLDPRRREKAAEDQVKLAAVMGMRVAQQPPQSKYLYGVARERSALDQIGQFEGASRETHPALFALLAEGLALQAQFEAAAQIAPEGPHQDEYRAKAAAIEHVNEQQCSDPLRREITTDAHAGLSPQAVQDHGAGAVATVKARQEATQLPMEKIFNGKVVITFTRCIICRAISAYAQ